MDDPKQSIRALVKRYFELLSGASLDLAEQILAPDFVFHHPPLTPPGGWEGRDVFLEKGLGATRAAFPDMRFSVADIVVEGNQAAARWVMTATHEGEYLGAPATGRSVQVTGMNWFEVRAGLLAIAHVNRDTWGLLQQVSKREITLP